ncbi:MAG TPA: hypothetical protein VJ990_01495 [Clostridia bacterium]|nr:hypothetical protein [Clostridia bacterium]
MNDISKSSAFCRKMKIIAGFFRQSVTGRVLSWKFYELNFFAKPIVEVQNFTETSLAAKYLSESFLYRQMQFIFEEEKSRNDKK